MAIGATYACMLPGQNWQLQACERLALSLGTNHPANHQSVLLGVQAGRAALAAAGRYSELVALLRARGRHDAALELIQSLSQHPDSLPVPPAGAAAACAITDGWQLAASDRADVLRLPPWMLRSGMLSWRRGGEGPVRSPRGVGGCEVHPCHGPRRARPHSEALQVQRWRLPP